MFDACDYDESQTFVRRSGARVFTKRNLRLLFGHKRALVQNSRTVYIILDRVNMFAPRVQVLVNGSATCDNLERTAHREGYSPIRIGDCYTLAEVVAVAQGRGESGRLSSFALASECNTVVLQSSWQTVSTHCV